jgi:type II secretory pathway component PulJ
MNLLEILISSLLGSVILISLTQSGHQIYTSLDQQLAKATLQSEALQALQMMGEAIQIASTPKGSSIPRLMVKDTASMSNTQAGQFQVRKGAASMDGSDAFFTTNKQEDIDYQAFFVQQQGHYEQRDGVLYIQTKNKKGRLQNDALIAHIQSMQLRVGIKEDDSIQWYEPYQISERVSKRNPHWKQVKVVKIHLKLQKGRHSLELQKIYALRHPS